VPAIVLIRSSNQLANRQVDRTLARIGLASTLVVPADERFPVSGPLRRARRRLRALRSESPQVVVGDLVHGLTRWLAHEAAATRATVVDGGTAAAMAMQARATEALEVPLSEASMPQQHHPPVRPLSTAHGKLLLTRAGVNVTNFARVRPWRIPLDFFTIYPADSAPWDTVTPNGFEHTRAMLSARADTGPQTLLLGSPFVTDGFAGRDEYLSMVKTVVDRFGPLTYAPHRRETDEVVRAVVKASAGAIEVTRADDCIELALEHEIGVPGRVVGFGSSAQDTLSLLYEGFDVVDARPPETMFTPAGRRFLRNLASVPVVSDRVQRIDLSG
jgi:hypothetical protein